MQVEILTDFVELLGGDFADARVRPGHDGRLAVQPGLARTFPAEHVVAARDSTYDGTAMTAVRFHGLRENAFKTTKNTDHLTEYRALRNDNVVAAESDALTANNQLIVWRRDAVSGCVGLRTCACAWTKQCGGTSRSPRSTTTAVRSVVAGRFHVYVIR